MTITNDPRLEKPYNIFSCNKQKQKNKKQKKTLAGTINV